ncbi:DUF2231 domain-containing protein [Leifsonia sp. Root112D2]|jgi:hypothetical protein|uniref:DUF2231 domain-containing protein n=1 Tax=Leifsonia sp. Root112D2 TaxID=1736426 RepID=UPI0006F524C4|nr:DUF2231 domain-containing protein [Leifsonia sp. Root112D2]KQV07776.1 hypothetical protein ASC63_11300 [Leifsonia sp. Root112D2]
MEFNGLPLHILLVHVAVVLVPLSALCTLASAVWPAARRRLGIVTPLLALVVLILIPIVTDAGQWLQERVHTTPLIAAHAAIGLTLYPWVVAGFIVALVQWLWYWLVRRRGAERAPGRSIRWTVAVVLALASLTVAVGSTVLVVQIGESGARAVWQNSFSETPK